jgi:hypothetical protein
MANVVEFYIPNTFQKRVKWTPPERLGKVIEFYQPAKKSAWKNLVISRLQLGWRTHVVPPLESRVRNIQPALLMLFAATGWPLLDGLRPALAGLVLGLMTSAATTRLIRSRLYGTTSLDPAVFVRAAVLVLAVAVVACLVPAWQAAQLDPMQALRTE